MDYGLWTPDCNAVPKTQMLINYVPGEESRIAIVTDGRLEEFYQERASAESHVGNIYKGKVVNVEPSIQAAFIDFGLERNGFLHVTDLHPKYFPGKDREEFEKVGSKTPHRDRPPIQKCLHRGDSVLVQVLKEGIGTKGPTLTSYLSIPGRFLVMMPDMQRTGVSRKIEDDDARREMRRILLDLDPPADFGFIIRTAGIGQTKTELKRDLAYLQRLWKNIDRRKHELKGPGELYTESDLVIRTIRDVFSNEIERIVVDDPTAARRAYEFLAVASPRSRSKVVYYSDPVPLFHRFDIEQQIESIHSRQVPLPSGGSLVIDSAEALVAIDVNSGKSRDARDAETNAYKTNLEAVDEICRQLRLRDLGGVVVNDFIDMRDRKHRAQIESRFRNNLKRDRARTRVSGISQFGLLEMTRQRMRPSFKNSIYTHCEACAGTGHVKTAESVVLDVMRRLALAMHHGKVARIELTISPDVAFQLLNRKRTTLVELERRFNKPVMVRVGGTTVDHVHIGAFDDQGGIVEPESLDAEQWSQESADMFVEMTGRPIDAELDLEDEEENEPPTAGGEQVLFSENGAAVPSEEDQTSSEGKGRRRRRRRGGRKHNKPSDGSEPTDKAADKAASTAQTAAPSPAAEQASEDDAKSAADHAAVEAGQPVKEQAKESATRQDENKPGEGRRRRRRRGGRGRGKGGDKKDSSGEAPSAGQRESSSQAGPSANGADNGRGGVPPTAPRQAASPSAQGSSDHSEGKPVPKPATPRIEPRPVSSGYSNRLISTGTQSKETR